MDVRGIVSEYAHDLMIETDIQPPDLGMFLDYFDPPETEEGEIRILENLLSYITEVNNTTRMWANRGCTPLELVDTYSKRSRNSSLSPR